MRLSDGTNLRTWTTGTPSARPPVVLLHGGPGLWDYLEPVAKMLEDLTVVHRYDQRGCGGSDPSDQQTMRRLQDDLDELRQSWGHERIVVLGHSFGATLALTFAAARPDHVAGLVYLSGVGVGWRDAYEEERRRRMTPEQHRRLQQLTRERTPADEVEFRTLSWFTDHADRARAWTWALADAAVPHRINYAANQALTAEIRSWPDSLLVDLAGRLAMPACFIHGAGDPRPASAVRVLANAVPDAEFHVIQDAGHHPWREQPAELRGVLTAFLDRLSTEVASGH